MFICWSQTDQLLSLWNLKFSTRNQTALPPKEGLAKAAAGHSCETQGFLDPNYVQEISSLASSCAQLWWNRKGLPQRDSWDWTRLLLPRAQSSLDTEGLLWQHQMAPSRVILKLCLGNLWPLQRLSFLWFSVEPMMWVKGTEEYVI